MAVTSRRLYWNRLPTTAVTLAYTVPAERTLILRTLWVYNSSAAAATWAWYLNYAGAAATSLLEGNVPIASNGRASRTDWMALNPGDTIHVQASAGAAVLFGLFGSLLVGAPE